MMTEEEYQKLWTRIAQLKSRMETPSYFEYLQREVYFQDYLDLFLKSDINSITYKRKEIGAFQTVFIPDLIPDPDGIYTITDSETGLIHLIVNHKYPFKNEVFAEVKTINYILIGEAAPGGGKYIYKDASNSYMTAPLRAKGVDVDKLGFISKSKKNKDQEYQEDMEQIKSVARLTEFAKNGFLLLDLFPFAIDFNKHTKLREKLIEDATLIALFTKTVEDQVRNYESLGIIESDWDFCFVGPETTSVAVIEVVENETGGLFAGKGLYHDDDKLNAADFRVKVNRKNKKTGVTVTTWQIKTNYTAHPTPGGNISHISKRARLTTIIGGNGPHDELVKRVFGL